MSPRRSMRDEDLDAVIGAVLRATQAFVGLALRSLDSAGTSITLAQYRMLAVLNVDDGQNVRDLAAGLGVDRSTATRMCNRLVSAGLIERTGDQADRRAVVISLTGEGRAVVAAVTRARRANVAALLRSLPPARREQLVDLLDEFADLAEKGPCM
ncbi:MAG TPA: MarR family transcriptional regulator [Acidimicrobiia bacterium]